MLALARGGLQFMLIIWLQGIWLPEHGYSFARTPLWAGIYMVPLTVGFFIAGPVSGRLADRHGARNFRDPGTRVDRRQSSSDFRRFRSISRTQSSPVCSCWWACRWVSSPRLTRAR